MVLSTCGMCNGHSLFKFFHKCFSIRPNGAPQNGYVFQILFYRVA